MEFSALAQLLLQLFVILLLTRSAGYLLKRLGQPAVIGEIIAGILLGPTLLGRISPETTEALFPEPSLLPLSLISQIGVVIFMFVIGMELDAAMVRRKARTSLIVSLSSILAPAALGTVFALVFYERLATPGTAFPSFTAFMAIAMSITAFPVLARILRDRGLDRTRLGQLCLSCAAADDVAAWCLLALITAGIQSNEFSNAWIRLGLTGTYILLMVLVVRPLLQRLLMRSQERFPASLVPVLLGGMLLSAFCTELIGIHALFGAFLFGLLVPVEWPFLSAFSSRIEDLSTTLLLPVFFVITGLRTNIGAIHGLESWLLCGLICILAIAGKLGGAALAARSCGETMRDSLIIGSLMNTRGLMQLIVLNIGYELGILSQETFSMMIIMALVTTIMTAPLLNVLGFGRDPGPGGRP